MKVVVVGLGGLGSAAAYWLAEAGISVVGLEQFEFGHVRGASHDTSRIIRHSYHTPHYVELTRGAYDAWADVERASGERLLTVTGGIDLFPPGGAIDAATYTESLAAAHVPYEWIDGAEVRRRWPAFTVPDEVGGLYQDRTGIVPAGQGTYVLQWLAGRIGADLRQHVKVHAIHPTPGGGVELDTSSGTISADAVIIAADAWADHLLAPLGTPVGLTVTREQVTYFRPPDPELFRQGRCPVWIWMDDPSFYGFPLYNEHHLFKAAEDCGGPTIEPDDADLDPDPAAEVRLTHFLEGLTTGPLVAERSVTCRYALTPDRDFVLDHHPEHPQIVVGLGAAHGFKFAPWFGQCLASLARGQDPGVDRTPFLLTRPGLGTAPDRTRWLV